MIITCKQNNPNVDPKLTNNFQLKLPIFELQNYIEIIIEQNLCGFVLFQALIKIGFGIQYFNLFFNIFDNHEPKITNKFSNFSS